jgi:hypothetical protein
MPTPVLHKDTPVHRLFGGHLNYESLRTFGCACWPSLCKYNAHKLAFWSKQCVFLGYNTIHKGYKCLDKSSRYIYISRDVVFDESVFPYATPRVSVDIPTFRDAIIFLSNEPATHDHVRQYDLSYLSTNPPLLGDDVTHVQVPLVPHAATPPSPAAEADLAFSPIAAAPAAANVVVSPAAAEPAVTSPAAVACGVPAPPGSPSQVPDMPEQPESPPAGSPPTPATTPPLLLPVMAWSLSSRIILIARSNTPMVLVQSSTACPLRRSGVSS